MNSKSIWDQAQNKPSLVAEDLAKYVDPNITYAILLRRGVLNGWL